MKGKEFWKVEIADREMRDAETFYVYATSAAEAEKKALALCPVKEVDSVWDEPCCRSCEFVGYIVA